MFISPTRSTVGIYISALVVTVALAACGGSDTTAAPSDASATTSAPATAPSTGADTESPNAENGAAAGTTTGRQLDMEQAARTIAEQIGDDPTLVGAVDCPSAAPQAKGETFMCDIQTDTGSRIFHATQTDDDGNFTFTTVDQKDE